MVYRGFRWEEIILTHKYILLTAGFLKIWLIVHFIARRRVRGNGNGVIDIIFIIVIVTAQIIYGSKTI
jgi:hypothetical protein